MTKQEKLDTIYSVIARKDLSFGCWIIRLNSIYERVVKFEAKSDWSFYLVTLCSSNNTHYWVSLNLQDVEKIVIVWHPVMIWDVLDYIINKLDLWYDRFILIGKDEEEKRVQRTNYREPIEEQSDECIDYIYSLVTQ